MTRDEAVKKLLTACLPVCSYHPYRIATHVQWMFHYCRECAASKSKPDGLPIVELYYSDAVALLYEDEVS